MKVTFNRNQVENFDSSLIFLCKILIASCNTYNKKRDVKSKFLIPSEKFKTMYENLKLKDKGGKGIQFIKDNTIKSVYDKVKFDILQPIISEDKVVDGFIKIPKDKRGEEEKVIFRLEKFNLPISEIYSDMISLAVEFQEETFNEPIYILIGFLSVLYYTVNVDEDDENLEMIRGNIDRLIQYLESIQQNSAPKNGGDFIKNALKNFNMEGISDMLNKVNGDPNASGEFNNILKGVTENLNNGKPLTDILGDVMQNLGGRGNYPNADEQGRPADYAPSGSDDIPTASASASAPESAPESASVSESVSAGLQE